jgi:hypothetical protein
LLLPMFLHGVPAVSCVPDVACTLIFLFSFITISLGKKGNYRKSPLLVIFIISKMFTININYCFLLL